MWLRGCGFLSYVEGMSKVISFWRLVGSTLSQITGERILVKPRPMLLLDFDHYKLQKHKIFLANLLTAASLHNQSGLYAVI